MTSHRVPIGVASARSGVKVPTIRYYEEIGLLPKLPRTKANRRNYNAADLRDQLSESQEGRPVIRGYARVSTDGQSVDAQVKQLRAAGAEKVWRETASGAKTDRAQLRRVLAQLNAGDVLMVTRLDRLARSTRDLLNILATIAEKKAGFRSLGDTWSWCRPMP